MPRPIYTSSPQMTGDAPKPRAELGTLIAFNFPFEQLECGQSFAVDFSETSENNIRNIASRNNRNGKRFKVLKHADCYEVGRIK